MADDDAPAGPPEQPDSPGASDQPEAREEDDKSEHRQADEGDQSVEGSDVENERWKRFAADAAESPFGDALGGASAQAGRAQAYQSWIRTVGAYGPATFVRDVGVLNITNLGVGFGGRTRTSGPIPPDDLKELIKQYAEVANYQELADRLRSSRLLVLRGAPGTGRATTAVRLLADMSEVVVRLASDSTFRSLSAFDFESDRGYLLDWDSSLGNSMPTRADVELLRDHVSGRACYLAVVVQHDVRYRDVLGDLVMDCGLPQPSEVFNRAVDYASARWPECAQTLRRLSDDARPGPGRGPQTPAEVHWLVAELRAAGKACLDEADLERLSTDLALRSVAGWFEPLATLRAKSDGDDLVRLAAFRVALAVLNENPYDLVADAGEQLTEEILQSRSSRWKPGRPVFAHQREDYVPNSRAHLASGSVQFFNAAAPATMVMYDDDRLVLAVLRYVWNVHNLRAPLLSWLETMTNDPRPLANTRAALVLGLLSSWDFSYTFHESIQPWASSADQALRRWVAAVVLDQASRNEDVKPVVREIVEDWCQNGKRDERWTAAIALGYEIGLQDPAKALKELRKLGCWEDGRLVQPATWSIARIFALGWIRPLIGVKPVIDALKSWLAQDRRELRSLALVAVRRIADMKVEDCQQLELAADSLDVPRAFFSDRGKWPLLVAIADADEVLLDPLVDLVWELSRSGWAERPTIEILTGWMRAAQKDPRCLGPLARFVALLGDDDNDRKRLLHILDRLRVDPDEPLDDPVADRLKRAIVYNAHVREKAG